MYKSFVVLINQDFPALNDDVVAGFAFGMYTSNWCLIMKGVDSFGRNAESYSIRSNYMYIISPSCAVELQWRGRVALRKIETVSLKYGASSIQRSFEPDLGFDLKYTWK